MRLYHAGMVEIVKPDVHYGRENADFGQGFYLTPDREFAYRWAKKGSYVNEYEFDEEGLAIYHLRRDAEWFDYIFQNRRKHDTITADAVMGPIANDTIYDTLGIISSGVLNPETALELLKMGPEYTQIALKTERAAERLKWLNAEKAKDLDEIRASVKQEEEKYQMAVAEYIQKYLA